MPQNGSNSYIMKGSLPVQALIRYADIRGTSAIIKNDISTNAFVNERIGGWKHILPENASIPFKSQMYEP
jgi:hypothetical protein